MKCRPQVAHFLPYLPGRSADEIRRQYRLMKFVKLSSNENPFVTSPKAAAALRKAATQVHLYPDGFCTALREALAKTLRVKPGELMLGAGSDEIIELLAKAYLNPEDHIVVSEHAFIRYQMAAELMGAQVSVVPMRGFTHDLAAMAAAETDKTKFVFIANPNNPTGTYNTRRDLDDFLNRLRPGVTAVIDEAYFEYARATRDYPDGLAAFKAGRNVSVLRTFSKIYGLAGLRVGYGVGAPSFVETLDRIRPPFNVAVPAQAAAAAALKDAAHLRRSLKLVAREKKQVERALEAMRVSWIPSITNFLLINVEPQRGTDVFDALLRRGVIVRAMEEYGYPHHVRVTIGTPPENRLFLKSFREVRQSL